MKAELNPLNEENVQKDNGRKNPNHTIYSFEINEAIYTQGEQMVVVMVRIWFIWVMSLPSPR